MFQELNPTGLYADYWEWAHALGMSFLDMRVFPRVACGRRGVESYRWPKRDLASSAQMGATERRILLETSSRTNDSSSVLW